VILQAAGATSTPAAVSFSGSASMTLRIDAVSARSIALPFVSPYRNARISYDHLDYLWVEVSAGGMIGRGEATAMPGYHSESIVSMLDTVCRHMGPVLVGRDLFAERELALTMEAAMPRNPYARSALDLALVDLRARLLNVPAATLMGGIARTEIPAAGIIRLDTPGRMAENALQCVRDGASGLQVKLSKSAADSLARVKAVRDAVGAEIPLAIDGNTSFTVKEALRVLDLVARFDIVLFEQPVPIHDIDGMARLVRHGSVPIFLDEGLLSAADALRHVNAGAADGFAVKLNKTGVYETRKVLAIADAANLPCLPGGMLESGFGTFGGVHFASLFGEMFFPAELAGPMMMRDTVTGLCPSRGQTLYSWMLPDGPGWGCGPYDLAPQQAPHSK
jgi:L-alanine-DL-glutamate epimerase-like enolase superfamily enzyme